jgi:hypothetical protein
MEAEFEDWWFSETYDGAVPHTYFKKLVSRVFQDYKLKNFSFMHSESYMLNSVTRYIYLLYTIRRQSLRKQVQGPNTLCRKPTDWSYKDEDEWQNVYITYFDTMYWETIFGEERSWEEAIYGWRYKLPSIMQAYTIRSRDLFLSDEFPDDNDYEFYDDQ